jgi:hypothetical protein
MANLSLANKKKFPELQNSNSTAFRRWLKFEAPAKG